MFLENWKMTYEGHENLSCNAPCSMYSVLFEHGIIDDPFYGLNEREYMKLSEKDCKFECEFEVTKDMLSKEYLELTFLGLDTICDITLNGTPLDSVKNMHRAYTYSVKELERLHRFHRRQSRNRAYWQQILPHRYQRSCNPHTYATAAFPFRRSGRWLCPASP